MWLKVINGQGKFQMSILLMMCAGTIQATELDPNSAGAKSNGTKAVSARAAQLKEDRAIALVFKRKDVQDWKKNFNGPEGTSRLGGRIAVQVEGHKGDVYTVHVYEDLPDHTATFNWYEVNVRTGAITAQI